MKREPLFTRPFVQVSVSNALQSLAFNMFLHFPGFLVDLGAGEVLIGVLVGMTALASIAVRPFAGILMDRRGRRPLILGGNLFNVAVLALYLTVDTLGPWLVVVRIAHGLTEALLFTAMFTYAADLVPAGRRTEGLALFGASGMLPIALGGVMGDIVLGRGGYRELFLVALGLAALAMVTVLTLPEQRPARVPGEEQRSFLRAVWVPDLLPLWWMTTSFAVSLAAYFTFLKVFVDDTGFGSVGLFFGCYAVTAVLLRIFFGWLPDRVGTKRVLYPALASLVAGFMVLAGAGSGGAVAVAGVLCGAGHGYVFPILFGMVVGRARPTERGAALAVFTGLFDLGSFIGGPLFGLVLEFGSFPTMFRLAGLLVGAGALVFALWDGPASPRSPADGTFAALWARAGRFRPGWW